MVINKRLGLMIGWLMVVTVWLLSLLPLSSPVDTVQGSDKIGHFLAYFGMTFWFLHLTANRWVVVCLLIIMGFVIEVLQGLTGYRYFEWADFLANAVGVLVAYTVFTVTEIRLQFLIIK